MTDTIRDPEWTTQHAAASLVQVAVDEFLRHSSFLRNLKERMFHETGTNLIDWIERVSVNATSSELKSAGFALDETWGHGVYRHAAAQLPLAVLDYGKAIIGLKVESVVDFLQAHRFDSRCKIFGPSGAAVRQVCIECNSATELWVIERHGSKAWQTDDARSESVSLLMQHGERFRMRRRNFATVEEGFRHAEQLIRDSIHDLGRDRTCDVFFSAERAYWQCHNDAGQMQKMRQDRLGLGWANHDHHTFRSSRRAFRHLIAALELMGLECRERFYAGRDAGWGAQVMEHPVCGIVVFADVDLGVEEIAGDFAHNSLPDRSLVGTVGLWCALHGEAFLQAGMHHLECQFDFDAATQQLAAIGVPSMPPFTDLPHLRQAFTSGQRWSVSEDAIQRALDAGWIDREQARRFHSEGAIGSHLEILQRRDGFKGFNPKGIGHIISQTDPRK